MDPLLLADHVNIVKHERILDIGTGCGIMPLLLLSKHPEIKITGVEIQKNLADIARKNIKTNNMENRSLILLLPILQYFVRASPLYPLTSHYRMKQ